jgi:hypothetical protein
LFRDRPVFEGCPDLYDGLVVPAHLAAHATDGLWGLLSGIALAQGHAPRFSIDPMTYWWLLPSEYWVLGSESGRGRSLPFPIATDAIRPTFRKLLDQYGALEAMSRGGWQAILELGLEQVVANVLTFQRRGVVPASMKAVHKYAELLSIDLSMETYPPERLLAPYVAISSATLRDQATMNEMALKNRQHGEELWAIAAFAANKKFGALPTAVRERLHLDEFDGVGVWVDGFDEYTAPPHDLRAYLALMNSLPERIWLMYGAYFSAIAGSDQAMDLSHGIYYTESKALEGPVGSGPAADRYYIPRLHRFYEPSRALAAMEAIPELRCTCPECPSIPALRGELLSAAPGSGRRVAWSQKLQRHFLTARRAEIVAVNTISFSELLDELREARDLVAAIPGALLSGLRLDVRHLDNWLSALEQ